MIESNFLVSVVIPTYKRDVFILKRAIDSVLAQTYKNIEILVVDDNAIHCCENYRKENKKLLNEYINQNLPIIGIYNTKNLGGALARNEGINLAKGKYITFLDDDDIFLPNKILNQINYMVENDLNCSFTDLSLYDENEKLIDRRTRDDIKDFTQSFLLKYHLTKGITSTETFMVDKIVLNEIGGFDDAPMGQEFYLMFKILNYKNLKIGYYKSDDIKAYRTKAVCISNGPNKISGEIKLYNFKKSYFYLLSMSERRYVKCRHRAVMSISYKRQGKKIKFFSYFIFSFITDPFISIKEAIKLFRNTHF